MNTLSLFDGISCARVALENVRMAKEHEDVITSALGVNPVKINSAIFSAQSRIRNYWCNWQILPIPCDKGIVLKDILIDGDYKLGRYAPIDKNKQGRFFNDKIKVVGTAIDEKNQELHLRVYGVDGKSRTVTSCTGGNHHMKIDVGNGFYRKIIVNETELLQGLPIDYTAGVSDTQRLRQCGNGMETEAVAHTIKGLSYE